MSKNQELYIMHTSLCRISEYFTKFSVLSDQFDAQNVSFCMGIMDICPKTEL